MPDKYTPHYVELTDIDRRTIRALNCGLAEVRRVHRGDRFCCYHAFLFHTTIIFYSLRQLEAFFK